MYGELFNISEYRRKYKQLFFDKYNSVIMPSIERWESVRKNYVIKQTILIFLILLILISFFIGPWQVVTFDSILELSQFIRRPFLYSTFNFELVKGLIIAVIVRCSLIFLLIRFIPSISYDIKKELIYKLGHMIEDFQFTVAECNNLFTQEELKESSLFPSFNNLETHQSFICKYKDYDIKFSELTLSQNIGQRINKSFISFMGLVIHYKSKHNFGAKTCIAKNGDIINNNSLHIVKGMILPIILAAAFVIFYAYHNGVALFSLKNILFLLMFIPIAIFLLIVICVINSDNDTENNDDTGIIDYESSKLNVNDFSCIISKNPLFTQLLKDLKSVFGAKSINCSFRNNNVYIAVKLPFFSSAFQLGNNYKTLKSTKYIEKFADQFIALLLLIDVLELISDSCNNDIDENTERIHTTIQDNDDNDNNYLLD